MTLPPVSVVVALATLYSGAAQAECWLIGNLAGQAFKAGAQYQAVADGLSGKVFSVTIAGSHGSVTPSNGMACAPVTPTLLVCTARDGQTGTIETWSIDSVAKRAVFTQARSGHGGFDGASVFVGDVLGQCK